MVGHPVSFDAAQAGSYAHRLRAYWSNLFQNDQFNAVMSKVERPAGRKVLDILHAGWQPREVTTSDSPPHYRANIMGEPMRALPTIMATQNSFAFRAPRMGSLLSTTKGEVSAREVNLEEKSRAMGYNVHELRMTDDVDEVKLAQVLGLAMDRRAMELLYSVAEASRRGLPYSQEDHSKVVACKRDPEPEAPAQESLQASAAEWISRSSSYTKQLAEGISHEDWERKLQQMCAQGHKGSRAPKAWVPGWSSHARRAGRRERSWSPTVWRGTRPSTAADSLQQKGAQQGMAQGHWNLLGSQLHGKSP
ncbi:hypothetical protein CYMTET_22403 [Cymbomonas tetramitiformis]|uniref:Uncharacterized protein n=1 Tax=Cymbomonas tetramitiformis TaxID=36881 RepID=A0AAE0G0M2_9CHLO|nr:hypothetical protein CYMTET_22403 [Cymbomonas tetramitiformis]